MLKCLFVDIKTLPPSLQFYVCDGVVNQNTGVTWFKKQEGYPETGILEASIKETEQRLDTESDGFASSGDFENALHSAYFHMTSHDVDVHADEDAEIAWDCMISDANVRVLQLYLLESAEKDMMLLGNATRAGPTSACNLPSGT